MTITDSWTIIHQLEIKGLILETQCNRKSILPLTSVVMQITEFAVNSETQASVRYVIRQLITRQFPPSSDKKIEYPICSAIDHQESDSVISYLLARPIFIRVAIRKTKWLKAFVRKLRIMLAVHEKEVIESRKVSIRYDRLTKTYFCFYHRTNPFSSEVILTYDVREDRWKVDTTEHQNVFETELNDLFRDEKQIPFEEQLRWVLEYLDTYFANQSEQQKINKNVLDHRDYSSPWFRRLRGLHRCASNSALAEQSAVLQRYSMPVKASKKSSHEQILSVNSLTESFYADAHDQARTKSFASTDQIPIQVPNRAPSITEIWLGVSAQSMDELSTNTTDHTKEEKLKKLADKFVTYFGGTFQCNVGYQYQLNYDNQVWSFIVLQVKFLAREWSATAKIPKTKVVFLIDSIPYFVRG